MLNWYCKRFAELTTTELYSILQARQDVFILEQTCLYKDIDSIDPQCLHLFCTEETDESTSKEKPHSQPSIMAYARIIPPNVQYQESSIGRVLTTANGRNKGLGQKLIEKAIDNIKYLYPGQAVKISAQLYLLKFYQSFGFVQISQMYLDDDIEHIDMKLTF